MKRIWLLAVAAVSVGWGTGCNKVPSLEDAKNAVSGSVDQATQTVQNTAEAVKQATGAAGSIEMQLDAPVTASACYAALYTFNDGRPSVVQITSYKTPASESFPSMMLRAETTAKARAELNGQKLAAKAFLQQEPNGPVWSADAKLLELTISTADDTGITAEFSGNLENVGTGESTPTSGKLSGSFVD